MKKAQVIIGIVLIFAAGILVGSFATGAIFKNRIQQAAFSDRFPLPRLFQRLNAELNLSAAQQREIDQILKDAHAQLNSAREIFRPEFEHIMDDAFMRLQDKLNPEQQRKLKQLYQTFQQRVQCQPPHSRGPHRMGRGAIPPYAAIKEQLNLTPEQEAQAQPIISAYLEQQALFHQAWRQRQQQGRESSQREQDAHRESVMRQLSQILTPEQMRIVEAITTAGPRRLRRGGFE